MLKFSPIKYRDKIEVLEAEMTSNTKFTYWYNNETSQNTIGYVYYAFVKLANATVNNEITKTVFYFDHKTSEPIAIKFSNQIPNSKPLLKKCSQTKLLLLKFLILKGILLSSILSLQMDCELI